MAVTTKPIAVDAISGDDETVLETGPLPPSSTAVVVADPAIASSESAVDTSSTDAHVQPSKLNPHYIAQRHQSRNRCQPCFAGALGRWI
jgi:hypothetical protein